MLRTVLVFVCCSLAVGVLPCRAHPIIVDANPVDWPLVTAAQGNLGHICRSAGPIGEYIWVDVAADERTDFAAPDSRVDLVEFRVTADQENLYFLARMADIPDPPAGQWDGAPQIQVAIDANPIGGTDWFGGNSDTRVDPNAYWQYLIITRFGSGSPDVILWYAGWLGPFYVGAEAISGSTDVMEFSVPWSSLDGVMLPATLRFTVAAFRTNTSDNTWDTGGSSVSNALDAVTNYNDPGDVTSNTWAEVSDQVVNYYFDVFFEFNGEPGPPVVVAQVLYDPATTEPNNEFYRLYNRSPWAVSMGNHGVTGYKIGDEETIGGGEGMRAIPPGYGNVPPGGYLTIACTAADLLTNYGITADLEQAYGSDDPGVVNLTTYPTWATGSINLSNSGDEVIVLDGCDTVVDVLVYEGGGYAGVTSQTYNCGQDEMLYRTPPGQDTDDCSVDFAYMLVPVELASFSASASPEAVTLSWETATESENLGFNVYRSVGNADRVQMNAELIPGAGTTLDPQRYSFVDERVIAGETYRYWLEQVDFTGTTELFGPVTVSVPGTRAGSLTLAVAPVPATDGGTVRLAVPQAGPVSVGIYDLSGRRVVHVFEGTLPAGSHSVSWSRGHLASGAYFARAITGCGWVTTPVIVE
ncbi:lamin tail domain-containing protein [Candidatus Fermentibacteria bacterium]|nr:lamin tail domain-containing protein [Candidatus Fermentibacteria bacterium]